MGKEPPPSRLDRYVMSMQRTEFTAFAASAPTACARTWQGLCIGHPIAVHREFPPIVDGDRKNIEWQPEQRGYALLRYRQLRPGRPSQ